MKNSKNVYWFWGVVIVLFLFSFISKIAQLITDYWWFKALGFSAIFLITLKTKIFLFFLVAIIFFLFAMLNVWIASRFHDSKTNWFSLKLKAIIILVVSFIIGLVASSKWFVLLQYQNQVPFNLSDPILFKDVAFYIFSLPFLLFIWKFLIAIIIITAIIVTLDYFQGFIRKALSPVKVQQTPEGPVPVQDGATFGKAFDKLKRKALIHLTVLVSVIFILLAFKHYLTRYSIMYSESGIVVGAGYTDVMIFLPIMKILMIFAIVITVLFYVWLFYISKVPKLKKRHIVIPIIILYLVFVVLGPVVIPGIVQSLKVSPNELNLEKPYIENNIRFTNIAFGLDEVTEKDFSAAKIIDSSMVERAEETIDNVRLLDWRPLTQTYKQTQEIRLYYDLSGIDIDRYNIKDKYTQVMISPRELDQKQIAANAQTWVNLHMVYTHGFGVVMSPVNSVTKEGLPDFFIKDIPPMNLVTDPKLEVTKPQVYYGEKENQFVLVNTDTEEFDFPQGTTNQYTHYNGNGGVELDSFGKKLMMTLRFSDIKLLLSSDITSNSKIMFDRSIARRINKITPFLSLDEDPYLVIDEGRLFWIQDAYTTSVNFPYSQKFWGINYMRNSVKVVVDAYNGDVSYYIIDKEDPLIQTYSNIFPNQFKSIEEMPKGIKDHIRYPVDLFKVQSAVFSIYHMNDSTVFYNKEDAWQIPSEIYGTGQQIKVEPYYIIIKLPGEDKEEFVLMTSFSPLKKDNMISWFAARSDGRNYGKLLLYKFPKDKLIYGPSQIEAKFDQDSEISQQLTLWSQQGSRVTRGNLLVIPIENSLLYIEPLYLQAEKGQLPQLKRVLVSDGERVVMEESLGEALEVLFGIEVREVSVVDDVLSEDLVSEANRYYNEVLISMENNNWTGIGENFDKLGRVLGRLSEE